MFETAHYILSTWGYASEKLLNRQCWMASFSPALMHFLSMLKYCSLFNLSC